MVARRGTSTSFYRTRVSLRTPSATTGESEHGERERAERERRRFRNRRNKNRIDADVVRVGVRIGDVIAECKTTREGAAQTAQRDRELRPGCRVPARGKRRID